MTVSDRIGRMIACTAGGAMIGSLGGFPGTIVGAGVGALAGIFLR